MLEDQHSNSDQHIDGVVATQKIAIPRRHTVQIAGLINASGTKERKPPALVAVSFFDDADLQLADATVPGLFHSSRYGLFFYVGAGGETGQITFKEEIVPPEGAVQMRIELHEWYADTVEVAKPIELITTPVGGKVLSEVEIATPQVRGTCHLTSIVDVAGSHAGKAPALAVLTFRDPEGGLIEGPLPGISYSDLYGSFVYLGMPGKEGPVIADASFSVPETVASVNASIRRWYAEAVSVIEDPALSFAPTSTDVRLPEYLAEIDVPVEESKSYEITLCSNVKDPLTLRFALVVPRFLDSCGVEIAPDSLLPVSAKVGAYRYLVPAKERQNGMQFAHAGVIVPLGAVRMKAQILRWDPNVELGTVKVETVSLDDKMPASAEGHVDLRSPFRETTLSGLIRVSGDLRPAGGILEIMFQTEAGEPVMSRVKGLESSDFFMNFMPLKVSRVDGLIPFQLSFSPPAETRRIVWRLRPEEGMSLKPENSFVLKRQSTSILSVLDQLQEQATCLTGVEPDLRYMLRSSLSTTPLWQGISRCQTALLGEAFCVTKPGDWVSVSGTLVMKGVLATGTRIIVHPIYFDHNGVELTFDKLVGCDLRADVGQSRYVCEGPVETGLLTMREAFLTPANTAIAAFYILSLDPNIEAEMTGLTSRKVMPDEVHADLDTTLMDPEQIRQSMQIAEVTQDLPARQALAMANASWMQKDAKAAQRAETLSNSLVDLNTQWLPKLPKQPDYDPDLNAILHLFKVIYPDESTGGAVRSAAIVEAQATRGLHPVVSMPLNAPRPGVDESSHDGIDTVLRNGVSICYPQYLALDRRAVAPADLLSLEAVVSNRIMRTHRIGMIHAASGFRGYENALKGLALARANNVPLLYEVRSFHEHTWRPVEAPQMGQSVTHLRMAQEDRCMAEADAVATISRAMLGNLIERGVPEERLFFVPNAIDPAFETQASPNEVLRLRHVHGLLDKTTIGYISNFSQREGHHILLDAFSRLVSAGQDLYLVMVGDGPEWQNISAEVEKRGLARRVVMPGNVDHGKVRTWYHAIDLFVVPRVADFASDYVTPLKPFEAMSQGIPVIMSDRPVTAEIAGEAQQRARVFPAGDSAALSALIEEELSDREKLEARANMARDWVMAERVWSSVIERYGAAYEMARRVQADRTKGNVR